MAMPCAKSKDMTFVVRISCEDIVNGIAPKDATKTAANNTNPVRDMCKPPVYLPERTESSWYPRPFAQRVGIVILLDLKSPFCRGWVKGKAWRLLHAGDAGIEADQGIENREDMAAVLHHTLEHFAQAWFALSFSMPTSQDLRRHFDIPAKFFRRMSAQKQAVEESCLTLRIFKFPQNLLEIGRASCRER